MLCMCRRALDQVLSLGTGIHRTSDLTALSLFPCPNHVCPAQMALFWQCHQCSGLEGYGLSDSNTFAASFGLTGVVPSHEVNVWGFLCSRSDLGDGSRLLVLLPRRRCDGLPATPWVGVFRMLRYRIFSWLTSCATFSWQFSQLIQPCHLPCCGAVMLWCVQWPISL